MLVLIGATARQDITSTHPMAQKDNYVIGVAAPWWSHAW